jgi:hypothetical protein
MIYSFPILPTVTYYFRVCGLDSSLVALAPVGVAVQSWYAQSNIISEIQ